MSKIVNSVVKGYFFGALGVSAMHVVESFEKLGLNDGEQYLTPFAIDGIAVLGLVLRSTKWSTHTRKMGLRLQLGAGTLSLAANVYAGSSLGGRIFGVLTVALFLVAEAVKGRMETRASELARAKALAEKAQADAEAAEEAAKRDARNASARNRRQAAKTPAPKVKAAPRTRKSAGKSQTSIADVMATLPAAPVSPAPSGAWTTA